MNPARGTGPGGPAEGGERERELGPALLQRLHGLLRALKLYDHANQTVQGQLRELVGTFESLGREEALLIVLGDYFYLNGVRLRLSSALTGMSRSLTSELRSRGLAGVRVRRGLPLSELEAFLLLLLRFRTADQADALVREASGRGLRHVAPVLERELAGQEAPSEADDRPDPAGQDERGRAKRVYQGAVSGTERVLAQTARSGRPALQQARRVVQPLVDRIMKNEYSIVGLAALKDHDEYTYAHCVNVSVLAIRIGQVLGLGRQELANLGVAALLHDVGKVAVPTEILQKAGRLDAEEWAAIRRHPLEGFKLVCRMPHLSSLTLETARVALQHHVSLDGGGYPATVDAEAVSTSARIVAVADFFDAVTAHRAYRVRPLTPFEALHLILCVERAKFDAAPVWALLQAVGHYPAGTVLEVSSGHIVLSLSPGSEDPRRPHCRVLVRPDGTSPAEDAPEVWEPMPASETVVRVLPPEEFGVDSGALEAA